MSLKDAIAFLLQFGSNCDTRGTLSLDYSALSEKQLDYNTLSEKQLDYNTLKFAVEAQLYRKLPLSSFWSKILLSVDISNSV